MNKLTRRTLPFLLLITMILSLCVTAFAAGHTERERLLVGERKRLSFSDTPYISSNPSVVQIVQESSSTYYAVGVGIGKAEVTGGTWMGFPQDSYLISVHRTGFGTLETGVKITICIAVVLYLLVFAEIVYIFIKAPKCGMSRLWALVPLVSNVLGLVIFIAVASNRNPKNTKRITCPTCGSVHPQNTAFCNICGTKLN